MTRRPAVSATHPARSGGLFSVQTRRRAAGEPIINEVGNGSRPRTKSRKRERIARAVTKRPTTDLLASAVTRLGMDLFTLVKLGNAADAPLFPAHLRHSTNAMGSLAERLPRQGL